MFVEALGVETFTKGLQIYLSKVTSNSYGSAKPENLYKALQLAIDADLNSTMLPGDYKIQEIFESWEFNSGYPIVYVKRSYNDRKIRFTQVRRIQFSPLFT
jgi:aminopeptidase N